MKYILPLAAMLLNVLSTITAVVFCLYMCANATPDQIRVVKYWMAGLSLLGLIGLVGGIFLLRADLLVWSTVVAFLPTVIYCVILIVGISK